MGFKIEMGSVSRRRMNSLWGAKSRWGAASDQSSMTDAAESIEIAGEN